MILALTILLVISIVGNIGLFIKLRRPIGQTFNVSEVKEVVALLQYFCEKAYTLYYQTVIIPKNIIKDTMTNMELETLRKEFYKSVIKHMGPNITTYIVYYLGSEEVLVRFIANFFEEKLIINIAANPFDKNNVLNNPLTRAQYFDTLAKLNSERKK